MSSGSFETTHNTCMFCMHVRTQRRGEGEKKEKERKIEEEMLSPRREERE